MWRLSICNCTESLLILNAAKSVSGIYLYADWLEEQGRYEEAFYLKISVELGEKGDHEGFVSQNGNGTGVAYGFLNGRGLGCGKNGYGSGGGYGDGYGNGKGSGRGNGYH